ncbi:MAG: 2,3-bisphosphoglycerate-independent phosphoglycerate mutase [Patescibacteria group bacterium]
MKKNLPLLLLILDGWGIAKPNKGNAITLAKTANYNKLIKTFPSTEICAHGDCVGLPVNQDGNSEAGHMNIGAGRSVSQDSIKINKQIDNKSFNNNPVFIKALRHAEKYKSRLHLMGMLSNGMSAHSDPKHLNALLNLAKEKNIKNIILHLITDGRDSPKYAALKLIEDLKSKFTNGEIIATIIGRFYAMDRKKKWARTKKTYEALIMSKGREVNSPEEALTESYNREESDEFVEPYIIKNKNINTRIKDNDSVIFFNLRSDRARQLAKAFVQERFNEQNPDSFKRLKILKNLCFVALTDFGPDLDDILTAYPSEDLKATLPMALKDIKQLYIAETEKYAHVTYFFNGGYAGKVNGEDTQMIPSPDVRSYDDTPIMKSAELISTVRDHLRKRKYDFTALNLAAPDMIGHTGNLLVGIKCCEGIDILIGQVVKEYLNKNGTVIITADHGNIEEMINLKTGEIDTEHSINPVPFVLVNNNIKNTKLRKNGVLGDIAPTILKLGGFDQPKEMTGKSLF